MGHPSVPASPPVTPPMPGSCQVRCARCHEILTVAAGITEFSCPKCQLPQMLPPELMLAGGANRRQTPPAQGIDPTKIQLPCARCKAILNVPHGLTRFNCPQCGVDLAVDLTKLHQYFSSVGSSSIPGLTEDLPEETNEAIQEKLCLYLSSLVLLSSYVATLVFFIKYSGRSSSVSSGKARPPSYRL